MFATTEMSRETKSNAWRALLAINSDLDRPVIKG